MCMRKRTVFNEKRFAGILLMVVLALTVFSFIVMQLWNYVLSPVLHVQTVNFWQAMGILVLSKILFGGFRGGWGDRRGAWRRKMYENWENMTPEQREQFRERWRKQCGPWRDRFKEEPAAPREGAGTE